MRLRVCLVIGVVSFTLAGIAEGAPSLRVLASSRSSGDFAVTSTSASEDNAAALYIRGYGGDLSGFGVVSCSRGSFSIGSKSTTLRNMASGRLYRLRMPFRGDCDVIASLSGSGRIKLQILG